MSRYGTAIGRPKANRRSFAQRALAAAGLVAGSFVLALGSPALAPVLAATAGAVLGIASLTALDSRTTQA